MICPKCGHENDADATFCSNCGASLSNSGSMSNLKKGLILAVIILASVLAVFAGYTYFSSGNQSGSQNQTPSVLNETTENGTNITWTPEYISFDKAKSIAVRNAAEGVTVSDPVLMKNRNGQAIYLSYYYYDGYMVGGIIINAKTGDILYKEQNIPSDSHQQPDTNHYNEDSGYYDDYQDDYYYEDDYTDDYDYSYEDTSDYYYGDDYQDEYY